MNLSDALNELEKTPATKEALIALVNKVSIEGTYNGSITVLYSGRLPNNVRATEVISALIESGQDVRVIDGSPAERFISSPEFRVKVEEAFDFDIDAVKEWMFHGVDGPWANASKRFVEATEGVVKTLTPLAAPDRVFGATELPTLLKNDKITTIDGIHISEYKKLFETYGLEKVFDTITINSFTQVQLSNLSPSKLDSWLLITPDDYPLDLTHKAIIERFDSAIQSLKDADGNSLTNEYGLKVKLMMESIVNNENLASAANKLGPAATAIGFMFAASAASAAEKAGDTPRAKEIMADWALDAAGSAAGEAVGATIGGIAITALVAAGVTISAPFAAVAVFGAALIGGILGAEGATNIYSLTKNGNSSDKQKIFDEITKLLFANGLDISNIPSGLDGETITIDTGFDTGSIVAHAKTSIAWMYALENLNPFVIQGDDGLYQAFNSNNELDASNYSDEYLFDRASMLERIAYFEQQGIDPSSPPSFSDGVLYGYISFNRYAGDGIYFEDKASGIIVNQTATNDPNKPKEQKIIFGSKNGDTITGSANSDHLYGKDGNDEITSGSGVDYIEGGKGNDSYYFNAGDGRNTIFDIEGANKLYFNSKLIKDFSPADDTNTLFHQVDGNGDRLPNSHIASIKGKDLIIYLGGQDTKDIIHLQGWNDNENSRKAFDIGITGEFNNIEPNTNQTDSVYFDDVGWGQYGGSSADEVVRGHEGSDVITANGGADTVIGGDGRDYLHGKSGDDVLMAGSEEVLPGDPLLAIYGDISVNKNTLTTQLTVDGDFLSGQSGNDTLIGSSARDLLFGGADNDIIYGGGGADFINGDTDARYKNNHEHWTVSFNSLDLDYSFEGLYGFEVAFTATGQDTIYGGGGADVIWGGHKNDVLYGENHDDYISGGQGNDYLSGGSGNDRLFGDSDSKQEENTAYLTGNDTLDGGTGNDELFGMGGDDILYGGTGNDQLSGDAHLGVLEEEYHGNDSIFGGSGDDQIWGDSGDDILYGESGNDYLQGDPESGQGFSDRLYGGEGDDQLLGFGGNDYLYGGSDHDSLWGHDGSDRLYGHSGNDFLYGDTENSSGFTDWLYGGDGNDQLSGYGQTDFLYGGSGEDLLIGGAGTDYLYGGSGYDTYYYSYDEAMNPSGADFITDSGSNALYFDVPFEMLAEAFDRQSITFTMGSLVINIGGNEIVHLENFDLDNVEAGAGITEIKFSDGKVFTYEDILAKGFDFEGTDGADVIEGTNGRDNIWGYAGDDVIYAKAGDDVIDGGAGNDTLYGQQGGDLYRIDSINDQIIELVGEGIDTVQVTFDYVLGDNLENLHLYGEALRGEGNAEDNYILGNAENNILLGYDGDDLLRGLFGDNSLYGGAGNDELIGGNGDDYLDGGTGADILNGSAGNDTYVVDTVEDEVIELPGGGLDTVIASTDYSLVDSIENGVLSGSDNLALTGNDLDNRLEGNSGNNTLDGGQGDDLLLGHEGDDTYLVNKKYDGVYELADQGNDTVITSISDYALSDHIETLVLAGSVFRGFGNDQANTLIGNDYNNILDGKGGIDVMQGGAGNDTYYVDHIDDAVIDVDLTGWGNESDRVYTSVNFTLPDFIEDLILTGSSEISGIGNNLENYMVGNSAANTLNGLGGIDQIYGYGGNDTLFGGDHDDQLWGHDGDDTLYGEQGNDQLYAGTGLNTLVGGIGDDRYYVDNTDDQIVELANEGHDAVYSSVAFVLSDHLEDLYLTGYVSDLQGTGNDLDNYIQGGWYGNHLFGLAGNDEIDGAGGADHMEGGTGNDTYHVNHIDDVVVEATDEGADTVIAYLDYTLGDNVENLTLAGQSITGTGNQLDNQLTGNKQANTLSGLAGQDVIDGATGNDHLLGGEGDDHIYGGDAEIDINKINSLNSDIVLLDNDDFLYGGIGNDYLDGGQGDDRLEGAEGNDILYGGDDPQLVVEDPIIVYGSYYGDYGGSSEGSADFTNDDYLDGGQGDDYLDGGSGNDQLFGGDGNDTLYGGDTGGGFVSVSIVDEYGGDYLSSDDYGGNSEQYTTILLSNDDYLDGGNGDDTLDGGEGQDQLFGGEGIDLLQGGTGSDILHGDDETLVQIDQLQGGTGDDVYYINGYSEVSLVSEEVVVEVECDHTDGDDENHPGNGKAKGKNKTKGNEGVGNGEDPPPPGHDTNWNDGEGTSPGNPGAKGGLKKSQQEQDDTETVTDEETSTETNVATETNEGETGHCTETIIVERELITYFSDDITELANEGIDTVYSTIAYTLADNLENLYLTGVEDFYAHGNELDNIIVGNDGNNELAGGLGNDILEGGLGNDIYLFGFGDGIDEITASLISQTDKVQFSDGVNIQNIWLTEDNDTLVAHLLGSDDKLVINGWGSGASAVDGFVAADGSTLQTDGLAQLIEAMSAFEAPVDGVVNLTETEQQSMSDLIVSSWLA